MFQYAFGRSLADKLQTTLSFDESSLKPKRETQVTPRSLELGIFNIEICEVKYEELEKLKPLFYRLINVISMRVRGKGIQTSRYYFENQFSFNSSVKEISNNCYLSGYWQTPQYFKSIESVIRKEFTFPSVPEGRNQIHLDLISKSNSISLHVRRTDFVHNNAHDIHGYCSLEYYQQAIGLVAERITDPYFFIFSDDIAWAKENLRLSYPCSFVDGNQGAESYIDMQLMSFCKHNIIANSSFSWWGAWLNTNSEKIVIAPKKWFSDSKMNEQTFDLIPTEWERM